MSFEEPVPAWYGLASLREEALDRLRRHRDAGSLVTGELVTGELVAGGLVTGELVAGERQQPDATLATGYRADVIGAVLPLLDPPGGRRYVNWHREIEGRYAIPYQVSLAIEDIFYALPPSSAGAFAEAAFEPETQQYAAELLAVIAGARGS